MTTTNVGPLGNMIAAQFGAADRSCEDFAYQWVSSIKRAGEFGWSAERQDDGRYQVAFARKGWGLHWAADLETGRVERLTRENSGIGRVVPDAPFEALSKIVTLKWQRRDWSNGEGIRAVYSGGILNRSKEPYVQARCKATLVVDFADGRRQTRKSYFVDVQLSPTPSKSAPWRSDQVLHCRAPTRPLEPAYQSFEIERAFLWVEIEARDAFGKVFNGAIREIPIEPSAIAGAWSGASSKRPSRPGL